MAVHDSRQLQLEEWFSEAYSELEQQAIAAVGALDAENLLWQVLLLAFPHCKAETPEEFRDWALSFISNDGAKFFKLLQDSSIEAAICAALRDTGGLHKPIQRRIRHGARAGCRESGAMSKKDLEWQDLHSATIERLMEVRERFIASESPSGFAYETARFICLERWKEQTFQDGKDEQGKPRRYEREVLFSDLQAEQECKQAQGEGSEDGDPAEQQFGDDVFSSLRQQVRDELDDLLHREWRKIQRHMLRDLRSESPRDYEFAVSYVERKHSGKLTPADRSRFEAIKARLTRRLEWLITPSGEESIFALGSDT